MIESTFVMLKPSSIERNLIGKIITRFEDKGLKISALKLIKVTKDQASKHYLEHEGQSYYNLLIESIMEGPTVVMVITGLNAISIVRKMAGSTNPLEAEIGTIRGDFSNDMRKNLIHSADSVDNAKREMNIYFSNEEIIEYSKKLDKVIN